MAAEQSTHRQFLDATLPYLDVVYRIALNCAADRWDAEDLVQETYLRAFAHFDQYRSTDARAWLAAICLNTARSRSRHQGSRPSEVLRWDVPDLPEGAGGEVAEIADLAIASFDRAAIRQALDTLPEPQRQSILLMDVAGYSAREAASILGCPRGTVLARVHRGRRRLARLLTGTVSDRRYGHGSA